MNFPRQLGRASTTEYLFAFRLAQTGLPNTKDRTPCCFLGRKPQHKKKKKKIELQFEPFLFDKVVIYIARLVCVCGGTERNGTELCSFWVANATPGWAKRDPDRPTRLAIIDDRRRPLLDKCLNSEWVCPWPPDCRYRRRGMGCLNNATMLGIFFPFFLFLFLLLPWWSLTSQAKWQREKGEREVTAAIYVHSVESVIWRVILSPSEAFFFPCFGDGGGGITEPATSKAWRVSCCCLEFFSFFFPLLLFTNMWRETSFGGPFYDGRDGYMSMSLHIPENKTEQRVLSPPPGI